MPRRHMLWILLAFTVSVAVRAPLLNRPLSGHHELCTALVLIALYNWHTDGFAAHHGAPAITFTGAADRIPPGYTEAPALHDGVLYYLSHPPLAFDLPHALFTVSGTEPNALGLQLFNLFFHLITAIGLYFIVRELQREGPAPLFAALLYLFMPAPLWFHSNVYMSDMFVQNAWVWHVPVALRALKSTDGITWRMAAWCALTIFLATLISWPGVWAGIALSMLALWQWRTLRDATRLRLVAASVAGVGFALAFTAWRWLQGIDADALLAYFSGRFAERGSTGIASFRGVLFAVVLNYRINWLPLFLPLLVLVWKRRAIIAPSQGLLLFTLLTALPFLLEHAFLLEYTIHDFTTLKAGLLFCGLSGLGLAALHLRQARPLLFITCLAGVLYFYRTNPIDSGNNTHFMGQREQGLSIAREAQPDEMVFTLGFTPEPQVQWYAKRTLFRVDEEERAFDLLRAAGMNRGILFRHADAVLTHKRITTE